MFCTNPAERNHAKLSNEKLWEFSKELMKSLSKKIQIMPGILLLGGIYIKINEVIWNISIKSWSNLWKIFLWSIGRNNGGNQSLKSNEKFWRNSKILLLRSNCWKNFWWNLLKIFRYNPRMNYWESVWNIFEMNPWWNFPRNL